MKISSKQVFTYTLLLGVLVLVAFYFLSFTKKMEAKDALIASNKKLDERVQSLKGYYDKQEEYRQEMAAMEPEIDEILNKYVPNVREEDVIMQAVNTQRSAAVKYNSINIASNKDLKVISEKVVKGAGIEKYQNEIKFRQRTATYANNLDYINLKLVLQSFFESGYNIGVSNITYTKSDTADAIMQGFIDEETGELIFATEKLEQKQGILNGTLTLQFYSVAGNGKTYEKPHMVPYESGAADFLNLIVETEEDEVAE